jgi:hypothetical protein
MCASLPASELCAIGWLLSLHISRDIKLQGLVDSVDFSCPWLTWLKGRQMMLTWDENERGVADVTQWLLRRSDGTLSNGRENRQGEPRRAFRRPENAVGAQCLEGCSTELLNSRLPCSDFALAHRPTNPNTEPLQHFSLVSRGKTHDFPQSASTRIISIFAFLFHVSVHQTRRLHSRTPQKSAVALLPQLCTN